MDPDLLRQRRNLIAISVVLLLFDFAEVRIGKINVLGTELLVGDPQVLMTFAWLMWAYFCVRYYQHWRKTAGREIVSTYRGLLDTHLAEFFRKVCPGIHRLGEGHIVAKWPLRYDLVQRDQGRGDTLREFFRIPIPGLVAPVWKLRAASRMAIHTHVVTDHLLPFALAVSAPIVTLLH